MVCLRCQLSVKAELEKLGIPYTYVRIGEAEIIGEIGADMMKQLQTNLKEVGLSVITNKKNILVEQVTSTIIELVHFTEDQIKVNLSDFLSEKLNYNYTYLANLFSEVKGTTIEKFYLTHKMERVKEMILYDDLNLTEISYKLHFSSVSHLSNQFRKFTGMTPTQYKQLQNKTREPL
jgi:AraC-like DNA-binding protein